MATGNFEFRTYLAVLPELDPQPDPDASLGGSRASTQMDSLESAVTSVADLYRWADSTQISAPDWVGAWCVLYDSPTDVNVNEAREIVAFDDTTGEFTFSQAWSELPVATDRFRLFRPNGLFATTSTDQSALLAPRHRLVYPRGGAGTSGFAAWVKDILPGPLQLECAVSSYTDSTLNLDIPFLANEEDPPDITTFAGKLIRDAGGDGTPQQWTRDPKPILRHCPIESGSVTMVNTHRAMWLRLSFRDGVDLPRPQRCVFQVMLDSDSTDEVGSFLVVVDLAGPLLEYVLGPDRKLRIAGGARVQAQVRDSVTLAPVGDYTINIALKAPSPGSLAAQNQPRTTEDGMITERNYASPVDEGEEGTTVTFQVEVV